MSKAKTHIPGHNHTFKCIVVKEGEEITCITCVRQYGSQIFKAAPTANSIGSGTVAINFAGDKLTMAEVESAVKELNEHKLPVDEDGKIDISRTVIHKDPTPSLLLHAINKTRKTRVLRNGRVAFKGSEAAFAIWCKSNVLLISDTVEHKTKGDWHKHGFDGFSDLSVRVSVARDDKPRPLTGHLMLGDIQPSQLA